MTHQEISDRLSEMSMEAVDLLREQRARHEAETKALRAACGTIGHVFGTYTGFPITHRVCVVCQHPEPEAEART